MGVDPDTERPGHSSIRNGPNNVHKPKIPSMVKLLPGDPLDPWLSDLLDTWSRAKRVTDFAPPPPHL